MTSTDDGVRVNTSGARTPPGPETRKYNVRWYISDLF